MKIISFLGTTDYKETTYLFDGQERQTRFFPTAVAQFLQPERLMLCVTPTVRKHANFSLIGKEFDELGVIWAPLDIPEGRSQADLWEIFDNITTNVTSGETVTFDVTHSFRSLPLLTFLAVAYLKAAKSVKIERILYGAWEARDEAHNISPVFDLTPFAILLDWLTATNRFVETGDGHALANLLKAGVPSGQQMGSDKEARMLGKSLNSAAEAIQSISLAMRLSRPTETMRSAAQLEATIQQALPRIQTTARPFGLLAEIVTDEYGQFALEDPGEPGNYGRSLRHQLELIHWYLCRQHIVQAATLAREWIISLLAYKLSAPMLDYEHGRKYLECAINNAVELRKPNPNVRNSTQYDADVQRLPQADILCQLWSQISEIRNDIAHCGMRSSPKTANLLKRKVHSLYPHLVELADQIILD
jgi:CRISPR-associated DxTHG motif protein